MEVNKTCQMQCKELYFKKRCEQISFRAKPEAFATSRSRQSACVKENQGSCL